MRTVEEERADALAFLDQRIGAAETMAARSPEFEERARWRAQDLRAVRDDLAAGLHEGDATKAELGAEGEV